jgi:DNA-binding MarR family transcriptional regulator
VSRQAIHQTIAELQELDLVELVPDPTHGRAKLLVLTERGRENLAAALDAFDELERELARRIGPEKVETLRAILEEDWGPAWRPAPEDRPSR